MATVLISPTTCDSVDRIINFLHTAQQYIAGAPALAVYAKPLRLQLVRFNEAGHIRYEIQVVE